MIKLYFAKITDFTQADYTKAYSLLNYATKTKIDVKKSDYQKKQSLAGLLLLYRGAYEIYGKTDFDINFNENGKPLCDFCFFNVSHCDERVVCAFSDEPIGVDIQKISAIKPRQKYKLFNEKENYYVNQDDYSFSERYIEIFTKKESALKMLGGSIANAALIDTFSDEFHFETQYDNGFIFTVCRKNI